MSEEQTIETLTAKVAELEAKAAELETDRDKWKGLSRKNEDQAKSNAEKAKQWDEHQESSKSEDEKRAGEIETLKKQIEDIKAESSKQVRAALAAKIAADKSVPAKYLTGDTEEELVASADAFLEDIKGIAPERPAGVVPSAGTGDNRPPAPSLDEVRERAKRFAGK